MYINMFGCDKYGYSEFEPAPEPAPAPEPEPEPEPEPLEASISAHEFPEFFYCRLAKCKAPAECGLKWVSTGCPF